MKAIETRYKGYNFRSRLEARWAVFFDTLKIKWEYEPEGFELRNGERYLPDFFLPRFNNEIGIYVEVKAGEPAIIEKPSTYSWEYYGSSKDGWNIILNNRYKKNFNKAILFGKSKDILLLQGEPTLGGLYLLRTPSKDSKNGFVEVCFQREYLFRDNEYRLFVIPGAIEDSDCIEAVNAARSARFEFGETP